MDNENQHLYNKKISERILLVLQYAGLELKGIATLTGKSIDIFYAIISGRRRLTNQLATLIGQALDFDGSIIFNINSPIPQSIKQSINLQKFKKENHNNKEFFIDTWADNKDSTFIKTHLIYPGYFSEPRYAWEVSQKLETLGRKINSDLLSKQLKYFVTKDILKSKRAPIKLKSGGYGNRKVVVYYQ